MIDNFKIYVPVLNEERLIRHTLRPLVSVFPGQVEVIDLGSTDSTLDSINGVTIHREQLPSEEAGRHYTQLKNIYSKKQPWVLWVDGDEIYPISTLLKIKDLIGKNIYSHRLYWRILKETDDGIYYSNEFLSAGPKLFHSDYQVFRKAWPKEVTASIDEQYKAAHKSKFNGLWFWHGVLLKRSNMVEATARRKKRESKLDRYNSVMTWTKFDKTPWEDDFKSDVITDWKVFDMNPFHDAKDSEIWTGKL